jgi:uncharacterized membrane protein YkoI
MRIYLSFVLLSASLYAADYARFEYDSSYYQACEVAALAVRDGDIIKVELKEEAGQPVYEFDIRTPDNRDWDISCEAQTAKVIETEEEVPSAQHPLFLSKKQVNEKQARETALNAWPGYIIEIEYEIEADGAASYEFDIQTNKGPEMKVEVDATSGLIVEQNEEIWQEGYE